MFKHFSILCLAFFLFSNCESKEEKNMRQLNKSAAQLNEKCPQMLDSETRLDRIEVKEPNTLVYKFTLMNVLAKNMDTVLFYRAMWPGLISNIKVSLEMKTLRENKTTIEYFYQDKENNRINSIRITPEDYLN